MSTIARNFKMKLKKKYIANSVQLSITYSHASLESKLLRAMEKACSALNGKL